MQPRVTQRLHPLDTRLLLLVRALFVICLAGGCYALAINAKQGSYTTQQKRTDQLYEGLEPGHPLIQSFRADRAYLTTLVFYASRLKDDGIIGPALIVHLRHTGTDKDLFVGEFSLGKLGEQQMLTFTFLPLETSQNAPYEFVIESRFPAGSVGIWTSAEDNYTEGSLSQLGKTLGFDLSFFTYYRAPLLTIFDAANLHFFFNMLTMLAFYLALTPRLTRMFEGSRTTPRIAGAAILVLVVMAGSYSQWGVVNPISVLFAKRDAQAMQWVRENTPPQATILVNSFVWGKTYWPADGGGWVKALTGRQVVYPRSQEQIASIDALIAAQKIQFVYLGQGYGELSQRHFLENPAYRRVYNTQGVSIFAVNPAP